MQKAKSFESSRKFAAFVTGNRLAVCPVLREEIWTPDRGDSDLDEDVHCVIMLFTGKGDFGQIYFVPLKQNEIAVRYGSVLWVDDR